MGSRVDRGVRLPVTAARAGVRLLVGEVLRPSVPVGVQRRWLEAVQRALPAPAATRSSGEALGGVAGDRVEREDADPTHALLYLHGGG